MAVLTHGSGGYNAGCRCDVCRTAMSERHRVWYIANQGKRAQSNRTWRTNHPNEKRNVNRRRESIKRGAIGGHYTEKQWQQLLILHDGRCINCGTLNNITRDHIVPLSKGGSDLITNIQPMCRSCNSSKGAKC